MRGIEKRAARINVPGWVGLLRLFKPLLSSRFFELVSRRDARRTLPLMDEEVARLGRSASARVTAAGAGHGEPAETAPGGRVPLTLGAPGSAPQEMG